MTVAHVRSPAKLNLGLEVLGKRADGYHEIRTILVAISLFDEMRARPAPETSLSIDDPGLDRSDNLALEAARRWSRSLDAQHREIALEIEKRIPAAAGLGGASGNAANTLRLANALYDCTPPEDELQRVAAGLGSDVPFFLNGAAALATGRGEVLAPISSPRDLWLVVVTPPLQIDKKTVTMYRSLSPGDFSSGDIVSDAAEHIAGEMHLEQRHLFNVFERPLLRLFPELEVIPRNMRSLGAHRIGLSGAGPTWYAIINGEPEARALAGELQQCVPNARVIVAEPLIQQPVVQLLDDRNARRSPSV